MRLRIDPSGVVHAVYDEMLDLSMLGEVTIQRASHVEPDNNGRWWADLNPVNGPRLGPFDRRSDALTAELSWLDLWWLTAPTAT